MGFESEVAVDSRSQKLSCRYSVGTFMRTSGFLEYTNFKALVANMYYCSNFQDTCDQKTYLHTYIHTYVRTYIRIYIHTFVHTYVHAYIWTYVHMCVHMYIRMYVHTHIHTYVHTYSCMQDHL